MYSSTKIIGFFYKELIVLSAAGLANIIALRDRVCDVLQVVEDEEDDVSIGRVAKQILKNQESWLQIKHPTVPE